ncbi:inositol-tetrakisphosphate 1-kinase-like isoform X1 [Mytilus trossulus]|uniref:inositol-tetrakisphosphate 1-kinase-like isoform X1 n=1 Tax=Mytilus trossulus TaxID=6551 RepID=UPI0030043891
MKRVGYWINLARNKTPNLEDQKELFRNAGIELVRLDIDQPLTEQGPFDLILHKCNGLLVAADDDNSTAVRQINNIKDYIRDNPSCILVDKFEHIQRLLNRHYQYQLVHDPLLNSGYNVFVPSFVNLTTADKDSNMLVQKLKEANVNYPFVCKPIVAQGNNDSHSMSIIFDESGLKDIKTPCVAQSFINHNSVLYKVYVVGSEQFIVEKPSVKNLSPNGQDTIIFDASKLTRSNSLTDYVENDLSKTRGTPEDVTIKEICRIIQRQIKMDLFGFDVIVDCENGRHAVIDINAFPGYESVDSFGEVLCNHLMNLMSCVESVSGDAIQYSDAEKAGQNEPNTLQLCNEH